MTDELTIQIPEPLQVGVQPLGEVLVAARNAKNLTQKDASDNLRLSLKQIDALETNAFDLLPDAMITRGFIRNYARFLDVDAEPLLASYRTRVPDKSPNTLKVQSSFNQVVLTKESQPWLKYILASILVLLFLLSWFFYMDYMPKPAKKVAVVATDTVAPATVPVTIPLPEIALPVAERTPEVNDAVVGTELVTPSTSVNTSAAVTAPAAAAVVTVSGAADSNALKANAELVKQAPSVPVAQLPVTQSIPAPVSKIASKPVAIATQGDANNAVSPVVTKKVSMSFSEKTWVSVTNKSGKVIYEKMQAAGSADDFDGEPPFNVVIGNAKAAKLMYLGKSVDLASSTKSNVARISLQ
jgi:cytoskeleton protein RodZ